MEFIDLAKKRYSVRKYKDKPVEKQKLEYILEAGRIAPSAANYQPWYFIVVQNDENRAKLATVYKRQWIQQAPVLLVICGDTNKAWVRSDGKNHCDIDISIATDHITLAAAEMDLGTCWICNFDVEKTRELLQLPENIEPIVILTLGYPDNEVNLERHATQRKSIDEIVKWEKFE